MVVRAVSLLIAHTVSHTPDCPIVGQIPLANVSGRQCSEACPPLWCQRPSVDPRGETVDIERHSRRHILQMHLRQPAVARLAESERADALGQRALDAGPQPIEPPLFVTRLARSGRGQRLVRLTGVKRELASLRLRPRAQRLTGAGLADGRSEVDFDAVAPSFVLVFAPTHAVLARGAAHALVLPIYRKGFHAEGPLPPVLPTHILGRGPDKIDPVALPGLHKL